MHFEFFSAVDTGRARSNNEDSVAVDDEVALAVLAVASAARPATTADRRV